MAELLTELLHRAAEQHPDHPAVEDERGCLTYAELAARAGCIAAALAAAGVQPGDRVGILMPKSRQTVSGIYGIMWSGGAYVPLDVGAPVGRLVYMIRNCGMKALITDLAQANRLKGQLSDTALKQIIINEEREVPAEIASGMGVPLTAWSAVAARQPLREPVRVSTNSLAYILYTSGSTGEPKGVMISHRNALAFVEFSRDAIGVTRDDRLSSHAPFHFDLSVFDLYVAALAQATVSIVPSQVGIFPVVLAEWIDKQRISVWYSVPSILVQLWEKGRVDRFTYPHWRKLIFAGEVFAPKYLRAWVDKLTQVDFYNYYGPTETNVCTWYQVPRDISPEKACSIGVAASSDVIYLRAEDGSVVTKVGDEGEIWVDGPTVALGYWGDDQKTADRFVPVPDITGNSRKLYRTGDIAFWDETGNLIFRGRRDHMVKSRGYRIELGDIETAMLSHPAVEEGCVVPIPDPEIGNRLRACLTLKAGQALTRDELERHLAERVPRYMVPQETFFLPGLPKTSTGKIDRRQLTGELKV